MTSEPTEHQGNGDDGQRGVRPLSLRERRPGLYAAIVIGITVLVIFGLALLGILAIAAFLSTFSGPLGPVD